MEKLKRENLEAILDADRSEQGKCISLYYLDLKQTKNTPKNINYLNKIDRTSIMMWPN